MKPLATEQPFVDQPSAPLVGRGLAHQHHGELIQGVRRNEAGELVPCLVSFPLRRPGSRARYDRNHSGCMTVSPRHKKKALRAAALTLSRMGCDLSGHLTVDCQVPVGLGLGSSTADVVSAIKAVSNAFGVALPAQMIAHIAVEAETAIDPVMFDQVMLFAQRRGEPIESWGPWFPRFTVVSVNVDVQSQGVDTLSLAIAIPTREEERRFDLLVDRLRSAFLRRDGRAIAEAATDSAEMNQSQLPLPHLADLVGLARLRGALGVQISHSGIIAGVLFDAERGGPDADDLAAFECDLARVGVAVRCVFTTGEAAAP